MNLVKRFLKDEQGLETVEWAVVAGVIVIGVIAFMTTLKEKIGTVFTNLGTELDDAATGGPVGG